MQSGWISTEDLLAAVGLTEEELGWFKSQFQEQMRVLTKLSDDGKQHYSTDAILLLRGLSAMRAQGATPEQIKGWFGLAAGSNDV